MATSEELLVSPFEVKTTRMYTVKAVVLYCVPGDAARQQTVRARPP